MICRQLMEIFELLYEHFGPQHWWPGDSQLEVAVGAILTQNTSWSNVEKAIGNLKRGRFLTADALRDIEVCELAELIRPAGYYRIKAKRLKNLITWLFENFEGRLEGPGDLEAHRLREELLSIKGIGPETADSILLYAFGKPVFVVDTYTARIATRHRLIETGVDYRSLQRLFEENLPADSKLYNEYHALLVRCGKEYCRAAARCRDCPLGRLPHYSEDNLT